MLAVFAVYRLATDLAWEGGPFHLFERWRGLIMRRFGADHWLSEGVSCPICLSLWLSTPIIYFYGPLSWLGIAGAVAFLVRLKP